MLQAWVLYRCLCWFCRDGCRSREATSTPHLYALVQAIAQESDLGVIKYHLEQLQLQNISDSLVQVVLPKKWHHVVKTTHSTPLRTAISYRNVAVVAAILQSPCVVSDEDKRLAFQKVLRHVDGQTEVEIVRLLCLAGFRERSPLHIGTAFESLVLSDRNDLAEELLAAVCQTSATCCPGLLGHVFLSVARDHGESQHSVEWNAFANKTLACVIDSGFDPAAFLSDSENWRDFGHTTLQRLYRVLPLLVRLAPRCPTAAMTTVLRYAGRHVPLMLPDAKDALRLVASVLEAAGCDIIRITNMACLSPKFCATFGFPSKSRALVMRRRVPSLRQRCRETIRRSVTSSNMSLATQQLGLPKALRDYLLLVEIPECRWEVGVILGL